MTVDTFWKKFPIKESELCLAKVLRCGQTFRWKNINNIWSFAISDRVVLLKQDDDYIHYSQVLSDDSKVGSKAHSETYSFLSDYFSLNLRLQDLYDHWALQHSNFHKVGSTKLTPFQKFPGIRILHQDPWETLISFICSSNNNVKRISKMCDNLCVEFGEYVADYEGVSYYSFPKPETLAEPKVESKLRELGFGYRAKYIYQTALKLTGDEYPDLSIAKLNEMREQDYETAHEFLLQLSGVGPKVADCICLMALDKHDVVPVDTHVYQIAIRDYKYKGKKDMKTMNKAVYSSIRLFFQEIFGPYAGWAQSVLFTADLVDLNNGTNIEEIKKEAKKVKLEETPLIKEVTVSKKIKREEQHIGIKIETEITEQATKRIRVR